jgi:hypothetical protein
MASSRRTFSAALVDHYFAFVFFALILTHVAAAPFHKLIRNDGVFEGMATDFTLASQSDGAGHFAGNGGMTDTTAPSVAHRFSPMSVKGQSDVIAPGKNILLRLQRSSGFIAENVRIAVYCAR